MVEDLLAIVIGSTVNRLLAKTLALPYQIFHVGVRCHCIRKNGNGDVLTLLSDYSLMIPSDRITSSREWMK